LKVDLELAAEDVGRLGQCGGCLERGHHPLYRVFAAKSLALFPLVRPQQVDDREVSVGLGHR